MRILLISFITIITFLTSCSKKEQQEPLSQVIDNALDFAQKQSLRMAAKYERQKDTFPRSYVDGQMTTSDSGWWCSGFFPGVLWYLYENDKDNVQLLQFAKEYTERIEKEKDNASTHDLGFMLYCSFGNAWRLTHEEAYKDVLEVGARSLASRYNPNIGLIRSWDFGKWQYPVIIDNMMNLEYLLWASKEFNEASYEKACIDHANKTMQNHYRDNYSCFHIVSYDSISGDVELRQNHQGYSDQSAWARGQAWGLYGYTVMYRETKDETYLNQAIHIANYILNHPNMPKDYIPYWDLDAPKIPNELRDASAAAIIASGLIELSQYVDKEASIKYLDVAETQIRTLASPEYTPNLGENGDFILMHSVGSLAHKTEVDVPLTYTDYYYVEALMRFKKLLNQ